MPGPHSISNTPKRPERPTRSGTLLAITIALCVGSAPVSSVAAEDASAWSFNSLRERARKLATTDYTPATRVALPEPLKKLNYDQYQQIQFRPDQGPWKSENLPFGLQFIHRGYLFADGVRVSSIENGQPRELRFGSHQFVYGDFKPPQLPADLGYAGLKLVWRQTPAHQPEIASFLGASYFRIVGGKQHYGSSARGLAIDTGESQGEEFPKFVEFWVEKPAPGANQLQMFALMDSPSVSGAYKFVIKPGDETLAEVEASFFARNPDRKFGLAPLTSMFLMGENKTRMIPDFRPEVHDADGLLIRRSSGEAIWRPLVNPEKKHHISRFQLNDLDGFGLAQRDTNYENYQDLVARYENRPTFWVKPANRWGAGRIELVEIPTGTEYNDNIVAYWVPEVKPGRGQEFRFAYTLSAVSGEPPGSGLLRVVGTRITPETDKTPPRFVIDFASPDGSETPPRLEARPTTNKGQVKNSVIQTNEVTGGWRVFFDLAETKGEPADLRVAVEHGGKPASEAWHYRYQPAQ